MRAFEHGSPSSAIAVFVGRTSVKKRFTVRVYHAAVKKAFIHLSVEGPFMLRVYRDATRKADSYQ